MKTEELKAKRIPVLEEREANRAKGDKMCQKTEDKCNEELRDLNLAIQGEVEYKPAKKTRAPKKTAKPADPIFEEDPVMQ